MIQPTKTKQHKAALTKKRARGSPSEPWRTRSPGSWRPHSVCPGRCIFLVMTQGIFLGKPKGILEGRLKKTHPLTYRPKSDSLERVALARAALTSLPGERIWGDSTLPTNAFYGAMSSDASACPRLQNVASNNVSGFMFLITLTLDSLSEPLELLGF